MNLACCIPPVDASVKWGPHTSYLILKLLCNMKPLSASHKSLRSLDSTSTLVRIMCQDHPLPLSETCYNNCACSISRPPIQLEHNPFQTYEIVKKTQSWLQMPWTSIMKNDGRSVQKAWLIFWKSIWSSNLTFEDWMLWGNGMWKNRPQAQSIGTLTFGETMSTCHVDLLEYESALAII